MPVFDIDWVFENGKKVDKNTLNFDINCDLFNVVINLLDKGYFPCFAALFSRNKCILNPKILFDDTDFFQWCNQNYPSDQNSLDGYFEKLANGDVKIKTGIMQLFERRQLEIRIGLLKPEAYISITTEAVKAFDDAEANQLDDSAIREKMIKDFDSNIIAYGIRFSDNPNGGLPNFEDYELFVYDIRRNSK